MDTTTSARRWLPGRRRWLAVVGATAALLLVGVTAVAAATYFDDASRPQRITFGQRIGGNVGATTQPGEPLPCGSIGSTVWYWMDAPGGRVSVDTRGSGYDTVLAAYRVTDKSSAFGALLDCNDDTFNLDSYIAFDTKRGDRILIQVGGYSSEQGTFNIQVGRP